LGKVVGKGTPTLSLTRFAEYRRGFDQATIYANGEDYRAGATIDFAHDPADAARARLSHARPLERSGIGCFYDALDVWREEADDVRGHAWTAGTSSPRSVGRKPQPSLWRFSSPRNEGHRRRCLPARARTRRFPRRSAGTLRTKVLVLTT
jgi:hypothetical protein